MRIHLFCARRGGVAVKLLKAPRRQACLRVPCLGYFLYSSYGIGLRSFLSLNDVELDLVPFL